MLDEVTRCPRISAAIIGRRVEVLDPGEFQVRRTLPGVELRSQPGYSSSPRPTCLHDSPGPADVCEVIRPLRLYEIETLEIASDSWSVSRWKRPGHQELSSSPDSGSPADRDYSREAGVRNLEREIGNCMPQSARARCQQRDRTDSSPLAIASNQHENCPNFSARGSSETSTTPKENEVGTAVGGAWTESRRKASPTSAA